MLSKKVKQKLWNERIETESIYTYYIKLMNLFSKRLKFCSFASFFLSMTIVFLSVLRFLDSLPFNTREEIILFVILAFSSAIFPHGLSLQTIATNSLLQNPSATIYLPSLMTIKIYGFVELL